MWATPVMTEMVHDCRSTCRRGIVTETKMMTKITMTMATTNATTTSMTITTATRTWATPVTTEPDDDGSRIKMMIFTTKTGQDEGRVEEGYVGEEIIV